VVDDNSDAAESLEVLLSLSGHVVRVAHDGEAAIEIARREKLDVVLLDIGLPGMDGYEVARRLRADHPEPTPVLVALTGYGREEDRRRAREAGIEHHVVKPIDHPTLQRLLASISEGRS